MTKNKISLTLVLLQTLLLACAPKEAGYAPSRTSDTDGQQLIIEPAEANVVVNSSINFTAHGGNGNYTYRVIQGEAAIDETDGSFIAGETDGEVIVRVSDNQGRFADAMINVNGDGGQSISQLQISSPSITLHYGELHTFSANGGTPPYSFSVSNGSGTIFQVQGVFIAGFYNSDVTVRVTDSSGAYSESHVQVIAP